MKVPQPVVLGFDPAKSHTLAPIMSLKPASVFWMCWKPAHLVDDAFNSEVLELGLSLRNAPPASAADLRDRWKLHAWRNFCAHTHADFEFWQDVFDYVTAAKPFSYVVHRRWPSSTHNPMQPRPIPPQLPFTEEESNAAHRTWKATCGPHAIAAACGISLQRVKDALPGYRGWTNPTMMGTALRLLGIGFTLTSNLRTHLLCEGVNRIQWEGPWLNPRVPARVAYRYTHWVAHRNGWVLCTACSPVEWVQAHIWRRFHLENNPPSPFHITHHYVLADADL